MTLPLSNIMLIKATLLLVLTAVEMTTGGHGGHTKKAAKYQRTSNHMEMSNNDEPLQDSDSQSALLQYQAQNTEGYYKFGYANPDGQYRVEEGSPDEGILGSYGYVGTDGDDVKVYYQAGVHGFQIITADIYKALLSERTRKLEIDIIPDIPEELAPTFDIEPYADRAPKNREKSSPFAFVALRARDSAATTPKTMTTTTTTTTSTPETETFPNNGHEDNRYQPNHRGQATFPAYGNMLPWRFSNSLVPPLYSANGAIPPIPVYYSSQFGIQPMATFPPAQSFPRFAPSPNMQLPLIIKV